MAANKFTISGNPRAAKSYDEFAAMETDDVYEEILYYPGSFNENPIKILKQRGKTYRNVSFKDTTFERVSFVYCVFDGCLLLSAKFIDCEFIDCTFISTNTNKSNFIRTLIDPEYFRDNFDLKNDTNIAADLYHSLYKNLSNERQPDRAKNSLYLMHRAEYAHLNSQLKRKRISVARFIWEKAVHIFDNVTSGYGLKLHRVFLTFTVIVLAFSTINYYFKDEFFGVGVINSPLDSIYFTLVTLTTLGYGDISPQTQLGKAFVAGEVTLGIVVISLFLTSISSRVVRS